MFGFPEALVCKSEPSSLLVFAVHITAGVKTDNNNAAACVQYRIFQVSCPNQATATPPQVARRIPQSSPPPAPYVLAVPDFGRRPPRGRRVCQRQQRRGRVCGVFRGLVGLLAGCQGGSSGRHPSDAGLPRGSAGSPANQLAAAAAAAAAGRRCFDSAGRAAAAAAELAAVCAAAAGCVWWSATAAVATTAAAAGAANSRSRA